MNKSSISSMNKESQKTLFFPADVIESSLPHAADVIAPHMFARATVRCGWTGNGLPGNGM